MLTKMNTRRFYIILGALLLVFAYVFVASILPIFNGHEVVTTVLSPEPPVTPPPAQPIMISPISILSGIGTFAMIGIIAAVFFQGRFKKEIASKSDADQVG